MRKYIVVLATSLDSHANGPGGDLSQMPLDGGFSAYNLERLRDASTILAGATTFSGFAQYWPSVADDESQPDVEREISRLNGPMEKVVISDTLTLAQAGAWADTTRIVPQGEAIEAVRTLRAGDGGDIITFGSVTTWNPLAAAGLVDEFHILIGPALLGDGPASYVGPRVGLTLQDVRRLDDSQLVVLRYAAATSAG